MITATLKIWFIALHFISPLCREDIGLSRHL